MSITSADAEKVTCAGEVLLRPCAVCPQLASVVRPQLASVVCLQLARVFCPQAVRPHQRRGVATAPTWKSRSSRAGCWGPLPARRRARAQALAHSGLAHRLPAVAAAGCCWRTALQVGHHCMPSNQLVQNFSPTKDTNKEEQRRLSLAPPQPSSAAVLSFTRIYQHYHCLLVADQYTVRQTG